MGNLSPGTIISILFTDRMIQSFLLTTYWSRVVYTPSLKVSHH